MMGHANNVVFLKWLENAAWDHSNHLGLGWDKYQQLGRTMVARETWLEYLAPARAGDQLLVATWIVHNDGRATTRRAYQIRRRSDDRTLLRGSTVFVCVDIEKGRARRMPPEFIEGYQVAKKST